MRGVGQAPVWGAPQTGTQLGWPCGNLLHVWRGPGGPGECLISLGGALLIIKEHLDYKGASMKFYLPGASSVGVNLRTHYARWRNPDTEFLPWGSSRLAGRRGCWRARSPETLRKQPCVMGLGQAVVKASFQPMGALMLNGSTFSEQTHGLQSDFWCWCSPCRAKGLAFISQCSPLPVRLPRINKSWSHLTCHKFMHSTSMYLLRSQPVGT